MVQRDRDGGVGPAWGPTILRSWFVGGSIKSLERFGWKAPFPQVIPTDNSHSLGKEKTTMPFASVMGLGGAGLCAPTGVGLNGDTTTAWLSDLNLTPWNLR